MYIQLMRRHYGVHSPIKHVEIPCDFNDVYLGEDRINEQLLLDNIPDGWLPVEPHQILLVAIDEHGNGTGQYCKIFRDWKKYFSCYVLELHEKPAEWWVT